MEFNFENKQYRVDRGVGTGKWLLLVNHEDGPRGWRLIADFDQAIYDEDIVDAAISYIKQNGTHDESFK